MSEKACAEWVERLPEWVARRLPSEEAAALAEHVRACPDCAAEARVIRALVGARPDAPAGLAVRVSAALRREPVAGSPRSSHSRLRRWPAWAASAAVLALAAGSYLLGTGDRSNIDGLGQFQAEGGSVWISDDGIVAGAPVLDELSEDALTALLEEMGG